MRTDDALVVNPTLAAITHAVFRIGIGLLFVQHGLQKMFGLFGGRAVPMGSLLGVASVFEVVGGTLLVLGLFTRPVAALLTLEMLVAFTKAHLPRGGLPIQNGGELPLLFALSFICLVGYGAGAFSLDALLFDRRARARDLDAASRQAA